MRRSAAVALALFVSTLSKAAAAEVATQISGVGSGGCAIDGGGGVRCWNGCSPSEDVAGLSSGVASIATGYNHTCAITTSGAARCWGWNRSGELGDGTTVDSDVPVDVVGLGTGTAAIATGGAGSTCALTVAGDVKCWGKNAHGQLGDGTTTPSLTPVDVVGLGEAAAAVSIGSEHACALTASGGVKCWGSNRWGQLGDGTPWHTGAFSTTPVDVPGLTSGVATISAGFNHTCALQTTGAVTCWGGIGGSTPSTIDGLPAGISSIGSAPASIGSCVFAAGEIACFPDPLGGYPYGPVAALGVGDRTVWVITPSGEVRTPYACSWPDACVYPFGDDDGDLVCEEDDPCTNLGQMQTFPRPGLARPDPTPPIKLRGLPPNHPAPGNVQLNLRRRFELAPGTSFGDLALPSQGARIVFFTASEVILDLVLPPGAYGGRGTAGWSSNPAGTTWQFIDATGGSSGKAIVTRMTIRSRGDGVEGPLVDVQLMSKAGTLTGSTFKMKVAVILGDSSAAAAGLCGQS